MLLPLGIVAFVAHKYLSPIPTGANDLLVIGAFAALGTVLGIAGGLTTHMRVDQGKVFVRAGFVAANLWILSMAGRLSFVLWTDHGGAPPLMRFSEQHQITSVQTWVSALILMVFSEVGTRIATIVIRAQLAKRTTPPAAPAATTSAAFPSVAAATRSTASPFVGAVTASVASLSAPAVTTSLASRSAAAVMTSTVAPPALSATTSAAFRSVAARPIDSSRGSDSVALSREVFEGLSR